MPGLLSKPSPQSSFARYAVGLTDIYVAPAVNGVFSRLGVLTANFLGMYLTRWITPT